MKNNIKCITLALAGSVLIAATAQAGLTPYNPAGTTFTGQAWAPGGGQTLLTSLSENFSFTSGAFHDAGSLVSTVYNNGLSGGYTFVYTFTITAGDISGMTANGFGSLLTYVGSSKNGLAFDNGAGGTVFDILGTATAPTTVTFVLDTTALAYQDLTLSFRDGAAGNIPDLAPVPEPTTVIAGALMLLPLGIGALRSIRKDRSV